LNKIFYYELKRMIFNRLFLGMFIVNGIFDWYILTADIITGIAYTAPFSSWSYGTYLGKAMPIAILTILLLLSGYHGKKQKQIEVLTMTTPVSPTKQMLIQTAVLTACFALLCILTIGISTFFYIRFFQFSELSAFILPSLLLILPCFVFSVGLGQLLGRLHQGLIFVFMLIVFVIGTCSIQNVFDFFGSGYFSFYPLTLPINIDGEPDFAVDIVFGIIRLLYFLLGMVFFCIAIQLIKRKPRRA